MKKILTAISALALSMVLVACGNKLTTTKSTYHQSGMVAVIKGEASSKHIHYRAANQQGTKKVNSGTFAFSVPITASKQRVRITAGDLKRTVTVTAATPLADYQQAANKYNMAVALSSLTTAQQKQVTSFKAPTKASLATMTPAEQASTMQAAATVKALMTKATNATKSQQLPSHVSDGVHQVMKHGVVRVRANVDGKHLMGYTMIIPVKAMKNKADAKQFGTTLALLGTSAGANAKTVMKKFAKETKDQRDSQTTMKTIKSNGVKFNVGFSTSDIYVYITK
ncbi:hypothetical protein [Lacticaseibacillus thailandensis]|nr:hypothetical protein [Lacticaseibacillus thailandensis]